MKKKKVLSVIVMVIIVCFIGIIGLGINADEEEVTNMFKENREEVHTILENFPKLMTYEECKKESEKRLLDFLEEREIPAETFNQYLKKLAKEKTWVGVFINGESMGEQIFYCGEDYILLFDRNLEIAVPIDQIERIYYRIERE